MGTLNDTAKIIAALPGLANALQRGGERNPAVTTLVEPAGDSRLA